METTIENYLNMHEIKNKKAIFDKKFLNSKDKRSEYINVINSTFEFLEEELALRIESIRTGLDIVSTNLNKKINKIKNKRKETLKKLQCDFENCVGQVKSASITDAETLLKIQINQYNNGIHELTKPINLNIKNEVKIENIGHLHDPLFLYDSIKSIEPFHLPSYMTCEITHNKKTNKLYVLERIMKSVQVLDTNCNFIETIYLKDFLNFPSSICTNEDTGDIYVLDKGANKILVIEPKNHEYKDDISVLIERPKSFVFDQKSQCFYITNRKLTSELIILDSKTSKCLHKTEVDMINQLTVDDTQLYLSSRQTIFIYNKFNLTHIRNLEFTHNVNFFSIIHGLYVLALKEVKANENEFKNSLLMYSLNANRNVCVLKEIQLDENIKFEVHGLLALDKKIILSSGTFIPSVHLINFF